MCRVIWHRLLLEAMVIEGWTWPVHHYSTSTDTRQDRSSDQVTLSSTRGWRSAGQVPIVFPCLVPPIPQCPVSSFQEWRPFRSFAAAASPSRCDVRSELAQLLLGSWTCCSSPIVPSNKVFSSSGSPQVLQNVLCTEIPGDQHIQRPSNLPIPSGMHTDCRDTICRQEQGQARKLDAAPFDNDGRSKRRQDKERD